MAKDYFTKEGLDVQPLLHTYGKAALQAVIENKADFATVAETPAMFSILEGNKIFVIANIEASMAEMTCTKPSALLRVDSTRATNSSLRMWLLLTCSISIPASAQT